MAENLPGQHLEKDMTASRRRHERGRAGVLWLRKVVRQLFCGVHDRTRNSGLMNSPLSQPDGKTVSDQPRLKEGTTVFDVEGGRGGRYRAFVLGTLDGGKVKDYQKSAEASGSVWRDGSSF